jgi:hypothetical protein
LRIRRVSPSARDSQCEGGRAYACWRAWPRVFVRAKNTRGGPPLAGVLSLSRSLALAPSNAQARPPTHKQARKRAHTHTHAHARTLTHSLAQHKHTHAHT